MALAVEPPRAQTAMGVWEGEIQNPERPVVGLIDFDAGVASFSGGPPLPITKRVTHAAQWKQRGAVLIGEPVGDGLDFWSEGGNLLPPNSQLAVHNTNGFHKYSQREYRSLKPYYFELQVASLAPDVVVETTWGDYKAGQDPLYAAVRRRLQ